MSSYKSTSLWKNAFENRNDGLDNERNTLVTAYESLRERVKNLISHIQIDMPDLTMHDITHVDALWQIASTIAGEDYPLNPAEAFILGGAFLLHDAAHCMAAYPAGLDDLKKTQEWLNVCARYNVNPNEISKTSNEYPQVVFEVLRKLHPKRAKELLHIQWQDLYLLEHTELRKAYGHIIGEISESHWWNPCELEKFKNSILTCPVFLKPATWTVDKLKVAILLRVADAAHIDSERSPLFLMALKKPTGVSKTHWIFQNKMNAVACNHEHNELYITGAPFSDSEQEAWWLAFDSAQLIHKELQAADRLLLENRNNQLRLQARNFYSSTSPELFARHVPAEMWYPVDASIKITNIKKMVENFGGTKLYGNDPKWALREILQNAVDSIHAARAIGAAQELEGSIEVALEEDNSNFWIHITDTGIGMSKFVLTDVLLDFGRSLWDNTGVDREWEKLTNSKFTPIGKFGIGFFSIFMLGETVKVVTRRHDAMPDEPQCWTLLFNNGLNARPLLRQSTENEKLPRSGTQVSVLVDTETLENICFSSRKLIKNSYEKTTQPLSTTCAYLAPAIDIDLYFKENNEKSKIVSANDWMHISPQQLLKRIYPQEIVETTTPLTDIKNQNNEIIGRATVSHGHYWSGYYAIGTVNGVYAGNINGLYGIVKSTQQTDLARRTATPKINKEELKNWAETQKIIQLENNTANKEISIKLIAFGADPKKLPIAENLKGEIIYEEFLSLIENIDERPMILHSGEIAWEDEDDVKKGDFDYFYQTDEILITPEKLHIDWLNDINPELYIKDFHTSFYIDEAEKILINDIYTNTENVIVGVAEYTDIYRECLLIYRNTDD